MSDKPRVYKITVEEEIASTVLRNEMYFTSWKDSGEVKDAILDAMEELTKEDEES